MLDSFKFFIDFRTSFDVRVPSALVDGMASLFAACATNILLALLLLTVLVLIQVVIFVVLRLVHTELAPGLFLTDLAAAPPHFAAVLTLVLPARPVEVLLLAVLFAAILACFEPTVKLAFALDEFLYAQLRFFFLQAELLDRLLKRKNVILVVIILSVGLRELLLQLGIPLLARFLVVFVLPFDLLLRLQCVGQVRPERVLFLDYARDLISHFFDLA